MTEEFKSSEWADTFSDETKQYYAMIGSPITQAKSPDYFIQYFRAKAIHAQLIAVDLVHDQLGDFFAFFRSKACIRGCVVTVPHKQLSVTFVDQLSPRAKLLGGVNVIRSEAGTLVGDMVDGLGFLAALREHEFDLEKKRIALIGAGGAGSAIALAIAECFPRSLVIHERSAARRTSIEQLLQASHRSLDLSFELTSLSGLDLVINATPVGMEGHTGLPFSIEGLESHTLVFDLVTQPRETAWLTLGRERGCEVVYGEEMVRGQFPMLARHMGIEL